MTQCLPLRGIPLHTLHKPITTHWCSFLTKGGAFACQFAMVFCRRFDPDMAWNSFEEQDVTLACSSIAVNILVRPGSMPTYRCTLASSGGGSRLQILAGGGWSHVVGAQHVWVVGG